MVKVGEPIFLSNILLYPLTGENQTDGLFTLDEISDRVVIEELPQARVEEIVMENRADRPLLMIDGEEVIGALQNRIVATSLILEPNKRTKIPTTCVERNRWEGESRFAPGRTCSFPSIRAIIAEATVRGRPYQEQVWQSIDEKLRSTRTLSKTSSMHDIYENLTDELNRYVSEMEPIHANGMVIVCGDRILGLDYFSSREIFDKFKPKLIQSYGLEAIDYHQPTRRIEIEPFLNHIFNGKKRWKRTKGGGQGRVMARLGKGYVARALRYQDSLIHLAAFPID